MEWETLQTQEGLDDYATMHGFIGAVMTSAKYDKNIIPMMASLTRQMLIKELTEGANVDETLDHGDPRGRGESFHLNSGVKNNQQQQEKGGCCK